LAATTANSQSNPKEYVALVLGWLVPGAGHIMLGDRKRGIIFMVFIHLLFFAGLLLGGIRALDRPRQQLWDYAQMVAGWPSLVGNMVRPQVIKDDVAVIRKPDGKLQKLHHPPDFAPLVQEVATTFCGVAGMLNLLVLVDLFMWIAAGEWAPVTPSPGDAT
jgi:TM2 domain-containing membrane protein YozV